MTSLVTTIRETLRYRGAIGQWSWVLHRVTGLGVLFFLILHVVDTSWAIFYPPLYEEAIAVYQSPLFTLGEFALVAAVVYHALNGLRIAIFDFKPEWWKHQKQAAWLVLGGSVALCSVVFLLMFSHVVIHYQEAAFDLQLDKVISSTLPFIVGMVIAIVAAVILSGAVGVVTGGRGTSATASRPKTGSRMERFWWSYMRLSGLLILPLVFGHLALMHVVQGVFDITAQGYAIAGTPYINQTGAATEFVLQRWGFVLFGAIAIWRLYDLGLLALTVVHGFNGLRYVFTDYVQQPILRRGLVYTCVIGALVLLVLGGGALLASIDERVSENAVRIVLAEMAPEEFQEMLNGLDGALVSAALSEAGVATIAEIETAEQVHAVAEALDTSTFFDQ